MKKFLAVLLAALLALTCTACGNNAAPAGEENVSGSVEELLAQVVEGVADPEVTLVTAQADETNFEWYFFIPPVEGAEGWVSEPMIGSIPHFVGLLRVPESSDPAQVQADIEKNLDPRKWICTEAEKTAVLRRGDLILTVMSDSAAVDKAVENFNALK